MRAPWSLADVDTIALQVVLPGSLAFVLAFAPSPRVLANRIAKDLVTVWTTLAVFAGDRIVLMLVAIPAVLAVSIALGHPRLGRSWWGGEQGSRGRLPSGWRSNAPQGRAARAP